MMAFATNADDCIQRLSLRSEKIYEWRNPDNPVLTDVRLKCGDDFIPAHKIILAANSQFFYDAFVGNQTDLHWDGVLDLKDMHVCADTMKKLVRFMYTFKLDLRDADLAALTEVAIAAEKIEVHDITTLCWDAIENLLAVDNCFKIWDLATQLRNTALDKRVGIFVASHFHLLCRNEAFLFVPITKLTMVLTLPEILHMDQDALLQSILDWVRFDQAGRMQQMPDLLEYIRFPDISKGCLTELLAKEPLLNLCETLKKKVLRVAAIRLNPAANVEPHFDERISAVALDIHVKDKYVKLYEATSLNYQDWGKPKLFRVPLLRHSTFIVHSFVLYVIGGCHDDENTPSSDVCTFDVRTNEWVKGPPLKIARFSAGATVMNGYIYVVGGRKRFHEKLCDVEVFNENMNSWTVLARTLWSRQMPALASVDGKLYAVNSPIIERYDPNTNKWDTMLFSILDNTSAGTRDDNFRCATSSHGCLFIFESIPENKLYRYNPDEVGYGLQWAKLTYPPFPVPDDDVIFVSDILIESVMNAGNTELILHVLDFSGAMFTRPLLDKDAPWQKSKESCVKTPDWRTCTAIFSQCND